jgi:hypothetical protein
VELSDFSMDVVDFLMLLGCLLEHGSYIYEFGELGLIFLHDNEGGDIASAGLSNELDFSLAPDCPTDFADLDLLIHVDSIKTDDFRLDFGAHLLDEGGEEVEELPIDLHLDGFFLMVD